MSAPIVLKEVSKRYGAQSLFDSLSFSLHPRERMGILGPNGSGKSTLLKLIAGQEIEDSGSVIRSKGLRVSFIEQVPNFDKTETPLSLAIDIANKNSFSPVEGETLARTSLSRLKIDYEEVQFKTLSGGQQKRVQIALALCATPDLLLLDEPTNHLDIEAILSLEALLSNSPFAWVMVSHDRWFLENTVTRILEVNRRFEDGLIISDGGYANFLEHRAKVLASAQKQLESLKNKVRQEEAWLKQGAKARSTKSKERTSRAHTLMDSLAMVRSRSVERKANLNFQFSERKTKRLMELVNINKSFGEKQILSQLNLQILAGDAIGILGRNGTGKTTLINLLAGSLTADSGSIKSAAELSISLFKQIGTEISDQTPLKDVLAPESDSVIFQGREVHVATWAQRFGFNYDQLQQPFSSLSGGEKAKARIACLMLETPDILILDEPTNDLDIDTLEMLENSLLDFEGAIVLVTHDRFMINRICKSFCGLDGKGSGIKFSSYEQWENEILKKRQAAEKATLKKVKPSNKSKRLGYLEQREYDSIEKEIQTIEAKLNKLSQVITRPDVQSNNELLQEKCKELELAQTNLDSLYTRWEELESKRS